MRFVFPAAFIQLIFRKDEADPLTSRADTSLLATALQCYVLVVYVQPLNLHKVMFGAVGSLSFLHWPAAVVRSVIYHV